MANFGLDSPEGIRPIVNLEAATALLPAVRGATDAASASSSSDGMSASASMSSGITMDEKRRPWWKGQVCYQVWPMSFKDSDGGKFEQIAS